MTAPTFWPLGPDGIDDPYPGYALERLDGPLRALPEVDMCLATGYREVAALLRDTRCAAGRVPSAEDLGGGEASLGLPLRRTLERMASLSDPPEHGRVRRPLQRAFAPAVVRPWRPRMRVLADELLADRAGDPLEVVGGFAGPLVGSVLDALLRLREGEGAEIRAAWRRAAGAVDRPELGGDPDAPRLVLAVHERIALMLRRVRAEPDSSPAGVLVRTAAEDPELTDHDLIANVIFLLTSGHRSGTQALALAVHSLARNPGQYELLRRAPELIPGAVEELLRFDGAVQMTSRTTREGVDVEGQALPAGQIVVLIMGAANRDPAVFPEGDRLDVTRPLAARHLSFGRGAHMCVGAALTRMLMQEALAALVERAERLELVRAPEWTTARRGFERCEVRW
jgi:cytochrome P450